MKRLNGWGTFVYKLLPKNAEQSLAIFCMIQKYFKLFFGTPNTVSCQA